MRGQRIGVLVGGDGPDRAASLATGEAVLGALRASGHEACVLHVDRDLDLALRQAAIDVAFIALHGPAARGALQGLLESCGVPHTGPSLAMASLASDKWRVKELLRLHNIPSAAAYCHARGQGSVSRQHGAFGFPCVVKPRSGSSGVGIARADDRAALESAIESALRFDDDALVERFLEGVEIQVAILDGEALGAVEVRAPGLVDYQARFAGRVELRAPRLSAERLRGVLALACRASRVIGCEGLARVDLILTARGVESVLEIDATPEVGPAATLPSIAELAGLDLSDLVERILDSARLPAARRRDRRELDRVWLTPAPRASAADTH